MSDTVLAGGRFARVAGRLALRRPSRATGEAIRSALAALPAARRAIVERAYFGGLSRGQIVRTLGVAPA